MKVKLAARCDRIDVRPEAVVGDIVLDEAQAWQVRRIVVGDVRNGSMQQRSKLPVG